MPLVIKNLEYIRSLATKDIPDLGVKLAEALQSIATAHNSVEQQTNSNSNGPVTPPSAINGLTVTAQNGHFQVAIQDRNPNLYRGIRYYVEHADNPNFTNSQIVHIGDSRNANLFLGGVTRYFRAYSAYVSSQPSAPVYHGTSTQPIAVRGGGAVGGPSFAASQGSGTGAPGVGMSGPGPVPYRGGGAPPVR